MENKFLENPKPIVSVWMITYNHEAFIAEAIESVLMQKTSFPIELVIGEDGSTDRTAEIVQEYSDRYPEIIKARFNKPNIGMIANMIKTLEECSGKYIALLEGDDYWTDPFKLEKQFYFLENNESYGLVHTNADVFDLNSMNFDRSVNNNIPLFALSGDIFRYLVNPYPFPMIIKTASVMLRANLIFRYFEDFRLFNDWKIGDLPLWLEFSSKCKIGYLCDSTVVYRIHNSSYSNSKDSLRNYYILKNAFEIRLYFANREGVSKEIIKEILNWKINFLLRYVKLYNLEDARLEVKRVFKEDFRRIGFKNRALFFFIFNSRMRWMLEFYEKIRLKYSFNI